MTPSMNFSYHMGSDEAKKSGYGVFGRQLHKSLIDAGVEDYGPIDFDGVQSDATVSPVALYAATPPSVAGWYEGQLSVLFTMWEFSDIPGGFRENVPEFDRILVPSLQNVELFSRFHPDVQYVPLAAEDKWVYKKRIPPVETFNFLTAGAGPRKGNEDVVRAFNRVFDGWDPSWGPEPRLTVRTKPSLGNAEFGGGRVRLISAPLDDDAYMSLFDNAHCFVSGSKGEGWGLIPFQAIMSGIPTILGDAHGHAAFAHLGIPLSVTKRDAGMATFWGDGGSEWLPDFEQMCDEMWLVYKNYAYYENHALFQAKLAAEEFSWERTANAVLEAVPEMNDSVTAYGTWKTLPQKTFPIIVKHHETFIVNGRMDTFDPGHLYHRPWSVKVMLAQTGNLDPSCVNVNEMGSTILPNGGPDRCPHCQQKYGLDTSLYPENLLASV